MIDPPIPEVVHTLIKDMINPDTPASARDIYKQRAEDIMFALKKAIDLCDKKLEQERTSWGKKRKHG